MELFILYVLPALLTLVICGIDFYRRGAVTVGEVVGTVILAVIPIFNILFVIWAVLDELSMRGLFSKTLRKKK